MNELTFTSHKPENCCAKHCKKCCGEDCSLDGRGAYMYANTCGCDGPRHYPEPTQHFTPGAGMCTVPKHAGDNQKMYGKCSDIIAPLEECSGPNGPVKTSKECEKAKGVNGGACGWYERAGEGSGVCYDKASTGFFAPCNDMGQACKPGDTDCQDTWIPLPGYEKCDCDGTLVEWNRFSHSKPGDEKKKIELEKKVANGTCNAYCQKELEALHHNYAAYPPNHCPQQTPYNVHSPEGAGGETRPSARSLGNPPPPRPHPPFPFGPAGTVETTGQVRLIRPGGPFMKYLTPGSKRPFIHKQPQVSLGGHDEPLFDLDIHNTREECNKQTGSDTCQYNYVMNGFVPPELNQLIRAEYMKNPVK